ncbi:hypothetical protein [Pseudomonas indica]|uniref:Uncharacterized protein n=2 Tax=Pseudomonas indica TaxID=137658 RepID=A0A1G9KDD3_9PSED|nr:hypothetical protein [Pseudomonas indica]PAU61532.1 hypothetical protein BZL42_08090 [Pseudomonas indica]SDL47415.1 hypothetical protein SAMN05216186_1228 [Pseudomonas indica]
MPGMQELLQQMLSGQQPDPGAMSALFAEHEDPRIRLMAQFMSQDSGAPEPEDEATEVEAEIVRDTLPPPSDSLRLRRRIRHLTEELHAAQSIGDTLAAALGACYLCWGEDDDCELCGGHGQPGWCEPDAELFAGYVAPAVARLQQPSPGLPEGSEEPSFSMPRVSVGPSNRSEI